METYKCILIIKVIIGKSGRMVMKVKHIGIFYQLWNIKSTISRQKHLTLKSSYIKNMTKITRLSVTLNTPFRQNLTKTRRLSVICYRPPLLSNNLHYVTLISISLHSAFHIKYQLVLCDPISGLYNTNLYLVTTCLMWPNFNLHLEGMWSHKTGLYNTNLYLVNTCLMWPYFTIRSLGR